MAEPQKNTAYTYGTGGRLTGESWTATTDATGAAKFAAVKTGSTFATGWGYSSSVLPTTIVERKDGVETQRWTQGFNALGDSTRITDVTAGNFVAQATQYDFHGQLLAAKTMSGRTVAYTYAPRGFVTSRVIDGHLTTFRQDAVGQTTTVQTPDGQVVAYEYSQTHALSAVRINGTLVSRTSDLRPRSAERLLARLGASTRRWLEMSIPSARAQIAPPLPPGPNGIWSRSPGLHGQPVSTPSSILMGEDREHGTRGGLPLFDADARARRFLLEQMSKWCQCDPYGGFDRPTLTPSGRMHIFMSGHLGPMFADKSYFSEPVGQALVDEVVAKADFVTASGRYYVSDIGRVIGYTRVKTADGFVFKPTRSVTLYVQPDNCSKWLKKRNEVLTMFADEELS